MNTSTTLSQLAAYAGTYQQSLFTIMYDNLDVVDDVQFWPGVKNIVNMTKININGGPKPWSGVFNPVANDLVYTGLQLVVSPWQRDLNIIPALYRDTWMGEARGKGEGANNMTIPFANYVWSAVMKSLAANINDTSVYFGLGPGAYPTYVGANTYASAATVSWTDASGNLGYYVATGAVAANQTPGTNPSLWENDETRAIMVGFGAILAALVNADSVTPFATGAITEGTANAYQVQKELVRQLPIAVQKNGGYVYQSFTDFQLLIDNYENLVSKYTETDNSGIFYLPGTNRKWVLKPVTWMTGSRRLIATPKQNIIFATDELSDFNEINTVKMNYNLQCSMTGVMGAQFQDPTKLAISDQV